MLSKSKRSRTKGKRMVKNVSFWCAIGFHAYRTKDIAVLAHFTKGVRERFEAIGDFQACQCGKGRFVPKDPTLNIVGCSKGI